MNTAVGRLALYANTTGTYNTAVGQVALDANTTGDYNTAIGRAALTENTTGDSNTAVGYASGELITTGTRNTLMGFSSGDNINTGVSNVCIGHLSGTNSVDLQTGSDNDLVGAYSRTDAVSTVGANVLGYDVEGAAGYTTIGKGTSDIRASHGSTTWSTVSDERVKKDIVDSTAGLSVINDLRPITYNWKSKKDISKDFVNYYDADSDEPVQGQVKQTNHGFIAQEVKAAIDAHPEIKEGHSIWRESPDGVQNLADGALIPMMVKAIQELSAEVETLKSQLGE